MFEEINTYMPLIGFVGALVFAVIKLYVDVEHMKKQITSLFDLYNKKN
tara:strand:- start:9641 stop:9784 length:144 start_codon:yes stop_codon:yes gene_type:complete